MRLLILSMLIFCCFAGSVMSQDYTGMGEISAKLRKQYDQALSYNAVGKYLEAVGILDGILEKEPVFIDALLLRSDLMLLLGEAEEAKAGFEKALSIAPGYNKLVHKLLAMAEMDLGEYEAAAGHFEQYLQSGKLSDKNRQEAESLLSGARFAAGALANPVPFQPVNIGEAINTPNPEYLPYLAADEQYLVYTSRVDNRQEDLFISEKQGGVWQKGRPMESLNTAYNESRPALAANGKFMVFVRDDRRGDFNLYYTSLQHKKWTPPQVFPPPINSGGWESQPSLSSDGRQLYFASDRSGGMGGSDLWVSALQADGKWGEPQNLGAVINTPFNEQAPFIHADGQTLYFMSRGHPGMGQYDLFFSRKKEDGSWGTPQNLGYPINTKNNEGAILVSLDGRTAFFDSDHEDPGSPTEDIGNADIFYFELYPEARPAPVTYVQARVEDAKTIAQILAKVEIVDLERDEVFASSWTDGDGEFLVCLPVGKNYALNVSAEGYIFHSENFALKEVKDAGEPFRLDIALQPVPKHSDAEDEPVKSKPVVLKNVFFETGSAALKEASGNELIRLQALLTGNPDLHIRINGHTDDVGAEEDNLQLSESRAKAVYDWLVEAGIEADRLAFMGFGESNPIASNDTEEGRQSNRRVEFEVVD